MNHGHYGFKTRCVKNGAFIHISASHSQAMWDVTTSTQGQIQKPLTLRIVQRHARTLLQATFIKVVST
jgi:RNAse (barnase) inhibitor barstar